MKLFAIAILGLAVAISVADPNPRACWDESNSCGTVPGCSGDPPEGAQAVPCSHYFCDEFVQCSWHANWTRMREFDRTQYTWSDASGSHSCVGTATEVPHPNQCCSCEDSGTIHNKP